MDLSLPSTEAKEALAADEPVQVKAPVGIDNLRIVADASARLMVEGIRTVQGGWVNLLLDAPELKSIVEEVGQIDYSKLRAEFEDLDASEQAQLFRILVLGLGKAYVKVP